MTGRKRAKTSVEVLAAQLVTKRERGRDTGTERAMGGEGPRTQSSLQQDDLLVKKRKKGGSNLRGGADERERERQGRTKGLAQSTTPRFYDSAVGPDGYVERPVLHSAGT